MSGRSSPISEFNVGDEACIKSKTGEMHCVKIRWKGIVDATIHPRRPFMYGIEYKTALGKHSGRGLFSAKPGHASLVLEDKLMAILQNPEGKANKKIRYNSGPTPKLKKRVPSGNAPSTNLQPKTALKKTNPPLKPALLPKATPAQSELPISPEPVKAIPPQQTTSSVIKHLQAELSKPTTPEQLASASPRGRKLSRDTPRTCHRASSRTKPVSKLTNRPDNATPKRPRSVPPKNKNNETRLELEATKDVENISSKMQRLDISQSVKRNFAIYPKSKFTPDLKYKGQNTGLPVARNTPRKKIYRSKSRDVFRELNQ